MGVLSKLLGYCSINNLIYLIIAHLLYLISIYKMNEEIKIRIVRSSYLSLRLLQIIINVTFILLLKVITNTLK